MIIDSYLSPVIWEIGVNVLAYGTSAVSGPYYVAAGGIHTPGFYTSEIHTPGTVTGGVHTPGIVIGKVDHA